MAIDWNQLLKTINTGLQVGSQLLPRQTGTMTALGGFQIPNQLAGAGLLGAGFALDKEPGEIGEARQSVRNLLTPESQTGQFKGYVEGFKQQFQPALTQQREQDIADIGRRFAAAFPATVGAQGPEFGGLSRYITEQALPREQALLGQLGLTGISNQLQAGRTLLETGKPDPLAQLAYLMGADLLTRGQGGQGTSVNQLGLPGTGAGAGAGGSMDIPQLIQQLTSQGATAQQIQQAIQAFQSGVPFGRPGGVEGPLLPGGGFFSGTAALARPPGVEGPLLQSGQFFSGTGGAAAAGADFGLKGAGLLGPAGVGSAGAVASAAISAIGSGYVGYQVGKKIGDAIESPGSSATTFKTATAGSLAGSASGAAIGFAVGGPPGAMIGAIVGGIAGAVGGAGAEGRREDAQRESESQSTASQRPQALQNAQQVAQASRAFTSADAPIQGAVRQGIAQLLQAGDPGIQQALSRIQQLLADPSIYADARDAQDVPQAFARALASGNIAQAMTYAGGPLAAGGDFDNPQSYYAGLLGSSETGNFDVATRALSGSIAAHQKLGPAFAELIQYVRSRVGGF